MPASSSAEAQLVERKNANVISDNMGAQEMKANGDSDAAAAMQRVTGLSVVDNQYVFVRGLGERYSNTTLSGSTIPTTEPDKKVVPLDLFPTGLIDSVQIAKSYLPDKSADFAGGLVQIVPLKFPNRPTFDLSWGMSFNSNATGEDIVLSPLGNRDWLGFDDGARAMPPSFPDSKIIRRGIYTPDVGFAPEEITTFGRALEDIWRPVSKSGRPGQDWSVVYGNRFGNFGVIGSVSQSYKEQYIEENRRFYLIGEGGALEQKTTTTSRRAPRKPSSASWVTSRISSRRTTGSRSRTSTRTAARTRAGSSKDRTSTPTSIYRNYPRALRRGRPRFERRDRRALLPGLVEQPDRLARELRPRQP